MRVAALRTDIGRLYIDDVENRSQRNFSSEPVGQSRYLHTPTDAELTKILTAYGIDGTLTLAALRTAVYGGVTPPFTSVDVSGATLSGLGPIAGLPAPQEAAIILELQNLIAPSLVETGPVLLSFVYGKLSKFSLTSYRPGSPYPETIARLGFAAAAAVACVDNDGVTPFSL